MLCKKKKVNFTDSRFDHLQKKCDQYWPTEGEENYEGFIVRLLNEYVTAFYTIRMLTIRNNKLMAVRD